MTPQQVAQLLPDFPRWVEARSLLLHDSCTLFGLQQEPDLATVIRDAEDGTLFVVGRPSEESVWAALGAGRQGEVIAPMALAGWLADLLPERPQARIIVYRLAETKRLPELSAEQVGFLDPARIAHLSLPDELREELLVGAEVSVIAAALVDEQPVAFCYAGATTESLWDVAIDTLEAHRRKGHAARAFTFMARHMAAQGKQPVWQALEENPASWRLAEKLGFEAVDELVMLELLS